MRDKIFSGIDRVMLLMIGSYEKWLSIFVGIIVIIDTGVGMC